MRSNLIPSVALATAALAATVGAVSNSTTTNSTLTTVCTDEYVKAHLPDDPFGITIDRTSVRANAVYDYSVSDEDNYPDATFDFCNVTISYSHIGRDDKVLLRYWMPSPSDFENRYLSTGGFGYAINQGTSPLPGGVIYGAVTGETDGGFGGFGVEFDAVFLLANGTINYDALYMFAYRAHSEMSTIGKAFTQTFYSMGSSKLYSYYQGCSEGGREGWSQVQRYGGEWDGAVIGAPAIRFSFQQLQHLYSNIVEQTLNYYPSACEFDSILNATINACDGLDGKIDGVVARTDLCLLELDLESLIGNSYYCAATTSSGNDYQKRSDSDTVPAVNGTVSALGVKVAQEIISGLRDSDGRQVYFSYRPTAPFEDGTTEYNSTTGKYQVDISELGSEFDVRFLQLLDSDTLDSLEGYTYDYLKQLMIDGWHMYSDTLQTDWPDLSPFHNNGGKIIHYHGESDPSIPPASSVRYWEAVRTTMYPNMTANASVDALKDWYQLFLVPGAVHCAPNSDQPNGPFPQTNLQVIIDWVEKDITPVTLNATHLAGEDIGDNAQICSWPLRPYWSGNGTVMTCEFDQASIDTWLYDLDGVPLPVY